MKNILLKTIIFLVFSLLYNISYAGNDTIVFTWEAGDPYETKSFLINVTDGKSFTIDWGNGKEATTHTGVGEYQKITPSFTTYNNEKSYTVTIIAGDEETIFKGINCHTKKVSFLDITKAPRLVSLICQFNELTELDVSQNTQLLELTCYMNKMNTLDVSKNTHLTHLYCGSNPLNKLDLSQNKQLAYLSCYGNNLTTLDISQNTQLVSLDCSSNKLETLNVSHNSLLTTLGCYNNHLNTLDLANNLLLTSLDCKNNPLGMLDISRNKALTRLTCSQNELSTLDISNNKELLHLDCSINDLSMIDISNNTELTSLCCYNNKLSLSNLYILSEKITTPLGKEFGMQLYAEQTVQLNKPFSLKGEMELGSGKTKTKFSISKNNDMLEEGTDYLLDYESETITFLQEGNFEAMLTNEKIVSNPDDPTFLIIPFKVTNTVAIEDIDTLTTRIYPNPATDYINLSLPETIEKIMIRIFSMNGELCLTKTIKSSDTIYVGDLSSGAYFYHIISGAKEYKGKLLIK